MDSPIYQIFNTAELTASLLDWCHPDDLPALRLTCKSLDAIFKASPRSIAKAMLKNTYPIVALLPVRPEDIGKPLYLQTQWSIVELKEELSAALFIQNRCCDIGFNFGYDGHMPAVDDTQPGAAEEFKKKLVLYFNSKVKHGLWDFLLCHILDRAAGGATNGRDLAHIESQKEKIIERANLWYPFEFEVLQDKFCKLFQHMGEGMYHVCSDVEGCQMCVGVSVRVPPTDPGSNDFVVIHDVFEDVELPKAKLIAKYLELRLIADVVMIDGLPLPGNTLSSHEWAEAINMDPDQLNTNLTLENYWRKVVMRPSRFADEESLENKTPEFDFDGGEEEDDPTGLLENWWIILRFYNRKRSYGSIPVARCIDRITRQVRARIRDVLDAHIPIWRECLVHLFHEWDQEIADELIDISIESSEEP
ncbi:hypothetical protein TWF730_008820 [Orbilia blumenaviensis]|uniref:F-box domain-containing protein n=1 Tax=Orbilia blumenaviensis TaxID=1796055 RepID=A0AAV9V6K9_9PEZI